MVEIPKKENIFSTNAFVYLILHSSCLLVSIKKVRKMQNLDNVYIYESPFVMSRTDGAKHWDFNPSLKHVLIITMSTMFV